MRPKVTKITIEVGDQVIKLTPEEARALRDELNNVIGETKYLPAPPSHPSPLQPPYKFGDTPFVYTTDGTSESLPSRDVIITSHPDGCSWGEFQ